MIPKERYEQQLEDKRWQFKSENIRIRDKHKCRLCGARKVQLDVHHIRYIYGREAWDYDDSDLVTLCHKCHEEIHNAQDFDNIVPGGYFYHKELEGVGIVESKQSDNVWFHACWTEIATNEGEDHGRLYIEDEAFRGMIRPAKNHEIKEFWEKVDKYYTIDRIIFNFGKYIKSLLPIEHPVRDKARNYFLKALNVYESQKNFVREKFNCFLLVSDDNFAMFGDNRIIDTVSYWPATELPFTFSHVAKKKDVIEKPKVDNSKIVAFKNFDFAGYRAATTEEILIWCDYTDHLDELHKKEDLPF